MSIVVPKRSTGGCLTCKRRKKKCDERRPRCGRCELGDFDCLGYDLPAASCTGEPSSIVKSELIHRPSHISLTRPRAGPSSSEPFDAFSREARDCTSSIPPGVWLSPAILEDMTSLIVSQYVKFSQEVLFRAPLLPVENGLLQRIGRSDLVRLSMYLGARVMADFLNGSNVQKYIGWIYRFCGQIMESSATNELRPSLEGRLASLYDLICLGSMVSGTMTGYSLLQRSTPVFLQLAALEPNIWVNGSSISIAGISIAEAFRGLRYEVIQFIIHDTMSALLLGTPPQLQYDTTSLWVDKAPGHYMEWIYGFPVGILILLAKINAWRASRMMGETTQDQRNCYEIERRLDGWNPIVDHTDEPSMDVARLAVQEAWRQAALIYLYMGMNQVNSADPRVEKAVRQVVQLGSTITPGSPLELHLLAPSLIAGVGARREKHRAALRRTIAGELLRKINPLVLPVRGLDFLAVLDHLWHGAGSGGRPVTWEDYVESRCNILPVL